MRVLDIGQCVPDHSQIRRLLETQFQAHVMQAHDLAGTFAALQDQTFDLILVNRKLDIDYSDGMDVIHALKASPEYAGIPIMLVSNYPEYQQAAVEAGAVPGFGKNELYHPLTIEKLKPYLM